MGIILYFIIVGCTIPGINWNLPLLTLNVKDVDKGEFYRVTTENILGKLCI